MEKSISELLRECRLARGLSLTELARLTDTSVPTLSRYENGWTRFEVSTLRKLATALNCRLRIALEPVEPPSTSHLDKADAMRRLGRLFWDADLTPETFTGYPVWVVERVLELGQLDDVHALQLLMGRDGFLKAVQSATRVSAKTRTFWNGMLEKEGWECMRKSSRQAAWSS
jgi:transcriptional regulator with XRE-family HTH domain